MERWAVEQSIKCDVALDIWSGMQTVARLIATTRFDVQKRVAEFGRIFEV